MPTALRLRAGVGASRDSEPDDVVNLKKALNRLGLYEPDPELGFNEFVDRGLAMAIRRFQKRRGLLETGEVRPGDDTERAIVRDLLAASDTPGGKHVSSTAKPGAAHKRGVRPAEDHGAAIFDPVSDSERTGARQQRRPSTRSDIAEDADPSNGAFRKPARALPSHSSLIEVPADHWRNKVRRGEIRLPVINEGRRRRAAVLNDEPAIFEIEGAPDPDISYPWHHWPPLGLGAVASYGQLLEEEARAQGVDPNLVNAIVYVENAQGGHYGGVAELFGIATSILPMNIREDLWQGLVGPKADFDDARTNIKAGVTLIRRIAERIEEEPTVAKIAALYNDLDLGHVTAKGKRYGSEVAKAYRERPWKGKGQAESLHPRRPRLEEPNVAP